MGSVTKLTLERRFTPSTSGMVIWFTGLSGSGKTTICKAVHHELNRLVIRSQILDGDELRRELCSDLGFSRSDRIRSLKRIAFVAEMVAKQEVVVLVATITPYQEIRDELRDRFVRFAEVFVNAPLAVCEARDPKGLYRLARQGEINGFTGVDDPFELPLRSEVECRTDQEDIEASAGRVLRWILEALPIVEELVS